MIQKTQMKLWLDDMRPAPDDSWLRVTTALDAIKLLTRLEFIEVSLDHDLGLEPQTGYDVLTWIEKCIVEREVFGILKPKIPILKVHTANPPP